MMNNYFGQTHFDKAYEMQMTAVKEVQRFVYPHAILGFEHQKTITLGKRANTEIDLLFSAPHYENDGFYICKTDRGGEATIHNLGQLVIYPIINLKHYNFSPKDLVCFLLKITKLTLTEFGIESVIKEGSPGLFVKDKKLAFIGLRIRRGVCYHGLSINVSNDITDFQKIRSCGLMEAPITSIQNLKGEAPSLEKLYHTWLGMFENQLSFRAR